MIFSRSHSWEVVESGVERWSSRWGALWQRGRVLFCAGVSQGRSALGSAYALLCDLDLDYPAPSLGNKRGAGGEPSIQSREMDWVGLAPGGWFTPALGSEGLAGKRSQLWSFLGAVGGLASS